ncbi:MAG TPA: HAD family hydrolase [Rhodospirillaceae bacterium]|nr:HAD family hydrolase [Rhodospirillaceae bacterium]
MTKRKSKLENPLYVLMISVHGLIRGHELELGRDADTGGQITYVIELARTLARHPEIEQVDLLTRLIDDKTVSSDYAQPKEEIGEKACILRIPCGPRRYLKKEHLWPHLDQLVDRCLHHLCQQERLPDIIHTHYADAGYVGQQLSQILGIPQIHTSHSLGLTKREALIANGSNPQTIDRKFNLPHRIAIEEEILARASLLVTSTHQEIVQQYGLYQNDSPQRCAVIPPGIDFSRFSPPTHRQIDHQILGMTDPFLKRPEKPMILALCRPVKNKNLQGLMTAYGQNKELQELANLVIIAGNREDIREMEEDQRKVLSDLLLDIDRYNLWGKVAIPKQHKPEDVPELYRLAFRRRGVFINPALSEPFGLTLIEAAASGLPFVATEDGGPKDIVENLRSGLLVDPLDTKAISEALKQILSDRKQWRLWSRRGLTGVARHYSWNGHVSKYMKAVKSLLHRERKQWRRQRSFSRQGRGCPLPSTKKVFVSDIDNTLLGNKKSLKELLAWINKNNQSITFGIATGRTLESTIEILKQWNVPLPNFLITSVGTEIHYGSSLLCDHGWSNYIHHSWRRDIVASALSALPGLTLQSEENQREYKLSYNVNPEQMPKIKEIYRLLRSLKLRVNLVYSHNAFLDVLPVRASKGHAIRYLAHKWNLPLENFFVAGDSGNDADMMGGNTSAIVVGNYSPELKEQLKNLERVYFAENTYAKGILEGLAHYNFDITNK